jgi:23S rRNA (uracil1939-C5)-methyltransferase
MVQRGQEIEIGIDRLAYGGRGVGRLNKLVVFVNGAAPGDVVRARVARSKRTFAEADVVAVTAPSPDRVAPRCPHFGPCGGCMWQHLAYPAQARAKESVVRESLERLGGLRDVVVRPIVAAADPWYYRNKMDFSFHPDGILGLHRRGDWNAIVPIETCYLQSPESVAVVGAVRAWARAHAVAPYDPVTRAGTLRSLVIREGRGTGDRMVGLLTGPGPLSAVDEFVRAVKNAAPATSIVRGIVTGSSDGAPPSEIEVVDGRAALEEVLLGVRYTVALTTFFQTNTAQAEQMVRYVVDRAQPLAGRRLFDLYCGVGAFSLPLARAGATVAGVEMAVSSIDAARANARANGIEAVRFFVGDTRVVLPAMVEEMGAPDVVVLDPPRAGAGGRVMRKIGRSGARRVIYVSCNPTTLAPDLKELLPFGYHLVDVQPFDLFPQTYHVEAVAVLDAMPDRHQGGGV